MYEKIQDTVIRSDDLPDAVSEVSKTFRGITVVLCTLSMLSNPKLVSCGLFDILPVKSLVIDEASQIDVFEFMVSPVLALWAISDTLNQHLFYKFSKDLTKVCFFGDPKQRKSQIAGCILVSVLAHPMLVPPYGSEEAGLETIFDVKHLKKTSNFLDTQCNQRLLFLSTLLTLYLADRLPIHLGSFISGKVYNGKLRSEHEIEDYSCITFIDVWKGKETRRGNSYLVSESAI